MCSLRGIWILESDSSADASKATIVFSRRFPTVERRMQMVQGASYVAIPDDACLLAYFKSQILNVSVTVGTNPSASLESPSDGSAMAFLWDINSMEAYKELVYPLGPVAQLVVPTTSKNRLGAVMSNLQAKETKEDHSDTEAVSRAQDKRIPKGIAEWLAEGDQGVTLHPLLASSQWHEVQAETLAFNNRPEHLEEKTNPPIGLRPAIHGQQLPESPKDASILTAPLQMPLLAHEAPHRPPLKLTSNYLLAKPAAIHLENHHSPVTHPKLFFGQRKKAFGASLQWSATTDASSSDAYSPEATPPKAPKPHAPSAYASASAYTRFRSIDDDAHSLSGLEALTLEGMNSKRTPLSFPPSPLPSPLHTEGGTADESAFPTDTVASAEAVTPHGLFMAFPDAAYSPHNLKLFDDSAAIQASGKALYNQLDADTLQGNNSEALSKHPPPNVGIDKGEQSMQAAPSHLPVAEATSHEGGDTAVLWPILFLRRRGVMILCLVAIENEYNVAESRVIDYPEITAAFEVMEVILEWLLQHKRVEESKELFYQFNQFLRLAMPFGRVRVTDADRLERLYSDLQCMEKGHFIFCSKDKEATHGSLTKQDSRNRTGSSLFSTSWSLLKADSMTKEAHVPQERQTHVSQASPVLLKEEDAPGSTKDTKWVMRPKFDAKLKSLFLPLPQKESRLDAIKEWQRRFQRVAEAQQREVTYTADVSLQGNSEAQMEDRLSTKDMALNGGSLEEKEAIRWVQQNDAVSAVSVALNEATKHKEDIGTVVFTPIEEKQLLTEHSSGIYAHRLPPSTALLHPTVDEQSYSPHTTHFKSDEEETTEDFFKVSRRMDKPIETGSSPKLIKNHKLLKGSSCNAPSNLAHKQSKLNSQAASSKNAESNSRTSQSKLWLPQAVKEAPKRLLYQLNLFHQKFAISLRLEERVNCTILNSAQQHELFLEGMIYCRLDSSRSQEVTIPISFYNAVAPDISVHSSVVSFTETVRLGKTVAKITCIPPAGLFRLCTYRYWSCTFLPVKGCYQLKEINPNVFRILLQIQLHPAVASRLNCRIHLPFKNGVIKHHDLQSSQGVFSISTGDHSVLWKLPERVKPRRDSESHVFEVSLFGEITLTPATKSDNFLIPTCSGGSVQTQSSIFSLADKGSYPAVIVFKKSNITLAGVHFDRHSLKKTYDSYSRRDLKIKTSVISGQYIIWNTHESLPQVDKTFVYDDLMDDFKAFKVN